MTKSLRSAKIYIYLSLFACLFNFSTNNQEGNFFLTAFEKEWKFILNDTPNAKKLADKLKSEKSISMIFKFENFQSFGGRDDLYYNASKKSTLKLLLKKVSFNLLT